MINSARYTILKKEAHLMNNVLLFTQSVRKAAGSGIVLHTRSAPTD